MKTFKIPVEWSVYDTVEIEAESFEKALDYVMQHKDEIPLGTEPEYIDGSYIITSENDINAIESDSNFIPDLSNLLREQGYGEGYDDTGKENTDDENKE